MRILVVDDDALERLEIIRQISCMSPEFTVAGKAWNGYSALAAFKKEHPDIVITDMKMPGMDGINLIRQLQQMEDPPEIIALSAFDDYDLVRNALLDGAVDYILKLSMDAETLYEALARAAERRGKKSAEIVESDEFFLQKIAYSLPDERRAFAEIIESKGYILSSERVFCILFRAYELYRFEDAEPEEYAMLQHSVISIIRSAFDVGDMASIFSGRTGEFFVLRGGKISESTYMIQSAEKVVEIVSTCLDITLATGYAEELPNVEGLLSVFRKVRIALGFSIATGNAVSSYGDAPQKNYESDLIQNNGGYLAKNKLLDAMVSGDKEGVCEAVNEIRLHFPSRESSASRNDMLWEYFSVVVTVKEYCARNGVKEEDVLGNVPKDPTRLFAMADKNSTKDMLENLLVSITNHIGSLSDQKLLVSRVDKYIEDNFGNPDLSVQDAAVFFNISTGYFSSQLRKLSGTTFSRRLSHYRIGKAKALLRSTDMLVYEIGEAVGIPDQFYFSRIFKRIEGLSPAEYRARHNGGEV